MLVKGSDIPRENIRNILLIQLGDIGDMAFEVLPTPGYTRDHICSFFQKGGILLSVKEGPKTIFHVSLDIFGKSYPNSTSFSPSMKRTCTW